MAATVWYQLVIDVPLWEGEDPPTTFNDWIERAFAVRVEHATGTVLVSARPKEATDGEA